MAEIPERKRLVECLPDFVQRFAEIKELMRVANMETDEISSRVEEVFAESFVDECSVYGIEKYERMLGINAVPNENLDVRRNRVKAYRLLGGRYNYSRFVQSLNELLGGSWNYDMICDSENYAVTFHVYKDEHLSVLEDFLRKMLPANAFYKVHVTKDWSASNYVGIVWQDDEIMEWR